MFFTPMQADSRVSSVAASYSMPAPTGGWNARDNIADMPEKDALRLDNWFPEEDKVTLRRGYEEYATDIDGQVETLIAYSSPSTDEMFAAAGGDIWDVSADGPATTVAGGYSNDRWQYVNFETTGGHFTVLVNGEDKPQLYNGTAWADATITGGAFTDTDLIGVNVFKERLFFVEKESLDVHYLPVNSIGGAADTLTLGAVAKRGGYLMAMGTWTFDGGAGIDDYAVFVTSKGEALIYQGTDPGDVNAWALAGVYDIGAPIGRRCFFKVGGELVVITQDGFQLLSQALRNARSQTNQSYSDKIRKAVRDVARARSANFGWQAILYPRGGMGIFNIPITENGLTHQYVVNTNTGSWCRFTGMNANCWEVYNDELYFGTDGAVFKADSGESDNGDVVRGDLETAFSYFQRRARMKHFKMVRPVFTTNGSDPGVSMGVNVDFDRQQAVSTPEFSGSGGTPWGSPWGSPWGASEGVITDWESPSAVGYCASLRLKTATNAITLSLNSTDWAYELGGVL